MTASESSIVTQQETDHFHLSSSLVWVQFATIPKAVFT